MAKLSFQDHLDQIEDPREARKTLYPLDEIFLLTLCGVISGCETFVDIEEYGRAKLGFLRDFLPFRKGTPSHDALSSLFRRLDPEAFGWGFRDWAFGLNRSGALPGVVAIDGKTLRGSNCCHSPCRR